GLALFAAALLPVLGIASFDFQGYSTVADRYLYIAMLGIAVVIAGAVRCDAKREMLAVAVLVVLVLAVRSGARLRAWHDTFSLMSSTLEVNPRSWAGHKITGFALARDNRLDEALPHYVEALDIRPGDVETRYNLANALLKLGRIGESAALYEAVVRDRPKDARIRNNYGIALSTLDHDEQAGEQFRAAIDAA